MLRTKSLKASKSPLRVSPRLPKRKPIEVAPDYFKEATEMAKGYETPRFKEGKPHPSLNFFSFGEKSGKGDKKNP